MSLYGSYYCFRMNVRKVPYAKSVSWLLFLFTLWRTPLHKPTNAVLLLIRLIEYRRLVKFKCFIHKVKVKCACLIPCLIVPLILFIHTYIHTYRDFDTRSWVIFRRRYVWSGMCKVYVVQEKSAAKCLQIRHTMCNYSSWTIHWYENYPYLPV